MNLNGLRVLNTRPLEQGLALHQAIMNAGGVSIHLPALAIVPTTTDWLKTLPDLTSITHAIFISTNAVTHFYAALKQQQLVWPSTIQTTAIGSASAKALTTHHIRVDYMPSIADSEHLLQLNKLQQVRNQTIVLVKGDGGRMDIQRTLLQRGAHLIALDVYRRVLPDTSPTFLHSLWHDKLVDIILFTSQQSIHNLLVLFGEKARSWLCNIPCVVISERLAEAARHIGMRTIIVSSYDSLLNTLEQYKD